WGGGSRGIARRGSRGASRLCQRLLIGHGRILEQAQSGERIGELAPSCRRLPFCALQVGELRGGGSILRDTRRLLTERELSARNDDAGVRALMRWLGQPT